MRVVCLCNHALYAVVVGGVVACTHLSEPSAPNRRVRDTCAQMSLVYAHQIFSDSNLQFSNGGHLALFFDLLSCPHNCFTVIDFILHILMYLFFTYKHKEYTAETYFLKFMSIFFKLLYSLLHVL